MTTKAKIVTGLAVGTAIGATLGLLFAPHRGAKTRAIIADKSKDVADAVGTSFNKAKEMVGLTRNGTKKLSTVS